MIGAPREHIRAYYLNPAMSPEIAKLALGYMLEAFKLIDTEQKWCQQVYQRIFNGNHQYCSLGAVEVITARYGLNKVRAPDAKKEACRSMRRALVASAMELIPAMKVPTSLDGPITYLNDKHPYHVVMQMWRRAIDILTEKAEGA